MGKIRVKTLGIEDEEKKQAEEAKRRAEEKRIASLREVSAAKKKGTTGSKSTTSTTSNEESEKPTIEQPTAENGELKTDNRKKSSYKAKTSEKRVKSKKYLAASQKVEKNKVYKLADALKLLPQIKMAKFDETVELHVNTTESGIAGNVTLPHGTGKMVRVAIATDELIAEIEKGAINFDVLVAEPQMMPKLAKVARVLGPKGLMPNPKNGTVTPKPEEVAKKYAGGQMNYKTEAKFPLMHLTVGKLSFTEDQLAENVKFMLKSLPSGKIKNVTLKSTMSPAIKLDLSSI